MTDAVREYVRRHLDEPLDRLAAATGLKSRKGRAELVRFVELARDEAAKAPSPDQFARHKGTVAYTGQQGLADDAWLAATGPNVEWQQKFDFRVAKPTV